MPEKENFPVDIRRLVIPEQVKQYYAKKYKWLPDITFWSDLISNGLEPQGKLRMINTELKIENLELKKELKSKTVEHREHELVDAIISLENAGYVIKIEAFPNERNTYKPTKGT